MYVSFRNEDNTWTLPQNMGPSINTPMLEATPFLASDNKTLYFSSAGYSNYGWTDIFVTRRLDSTWCNWSEPKCAKIVNYNGTHPGQAQDPYETGLHAGESVGLRVQR